jgi:hypothetical protein
MATTEPARPQPVTSGPPPENLDDAIAAFEASFGKSDPPSPEAPDVPRDVDAEDAPPADPPAKEAPAAEAPAPAEPAKEIPSRAALRLMRQEARLRDERAAFERDRAAWVAERTAANQGTADARTLIQRAKADPVGFIKALGLDHGHYGRVLLADALGDKAPEGFRQLGAQFQEKAAVSSEIEQLRETVNQLQAAAAAREAAANLDRDAETFAASPAVTKFPHLAKLVTRKGAPHLAAQIRSEILEDAGRRVRTEGPTAQAITPAQAAARIHQRIVDLLDDVPEPKGTPATSAAKPATGASNESTRTAPGRSTAISDDDALKLAMDEFARR